MTIAFVVVLAILAAALVVLGATRLRDRVRPSARPSPPTTGTRILFPFIAQALSPSALEAALRLARVEGATLVPVFLARVSLDLPLEAPLPRQCALALPLLEAIEHRATEAGVAVDARIERGRNRRHGLRRAIANEHFDRIVIAAAAHGSAGFDADEVAWLLDNAPGEIIVLRPSGEERFAPPVPPAALAPEQPLPTA
jgi:hypothetical protein